MVQMCSPILQATPVRTSVADDPADLLRFAINAHQAGPVALATLVEIRGGAARALGSHVVVAADGRFCGYVSGGCVEAAVAAEALLAMAVGRDRVVKFGGGSPFFDIVLPCGGGVSMAIHVLREVGALRQALDRLAQRQAVGLRYSPQQETLEVVEMPVRSSWIEGDFITAYRPMTRVLISGRTAEAEAVARLAEAAGYGVTRWRTGDGIKNAVQDIDPYSAVVLLHHDLDAETVVLAAALRSSAFYIGALGSTRTHRQRVQRLTVQAFKTEDINRIKAPIGMFGPTRDTTSLALSVLADIAASTLIAFG
ncbi:XdhC family protein [Agrobacterium pusense]|uniref:XdhC family protein n=1 Tax=Agrobacterium pusense TaxID=648995 RepID=UPI003FD09EC2